MASIEIERHNVTEAQFRSYCNQRIRSSKHNFSNIEIFKDMGHGDTELHTVFHDWGKEIYGDSDGYYQIALTYNSGEQTNLIFQFEDMGDGKGNGYCYISDNSI